ncbi:MAG: hypothetical protein ACRBFS_09665 [Aureispira sp.]
MEYYEDFWDKKAQFFSDNPDHEYVTTFIRLDFQEKTLYKKVFFGEDRQHFNIESIYKGYNNHWKEACLPFIVLLGDPINLSKEDFEVHEHCVFNDPQKYYFAPPKETSLYKGTWTNTDFLDEFVKKREFKSLDDQFPIQYYGQVTLTKDSLFTKGWGDEPLEYKIVWINNQEFRTTEPAYYLKAQLDSSNHQMTLCLIENNRLIWQHNYSNTPTIDFNYKNYAPALKKYCLMGTYKDIQTKEQIVISKDRIGSAIYRLEEDYNGINTNENLMFLKDSSLPEDFSSNCCWNFNKDTLEIYSIYNIPNECCMEIKKGKKIRTLILESNQITPTIPSNL